MTLRVRLEIVPQGVEEAAFEIGRLDISNMGHLKEPSHLCSYRVIEINPRGRSALHEDRVAHDRSRGAWQLVSAVIDILGINGP